MAAAMDMQQYRKYGKELIDYICNYYETIEKRRVTSPVEPGYLKPLLPKEAPKQGEDWPAILNDVETKIMPGITHWMHPGFHAYFPSGNSYASMLGDMLSDAIGCIGFSWASSPACTELETIVLDWMAKALSLPSHFVFSNPGSKGGGVIQGSSSESILVVMMAARAQAIAYLKDQAQDYDTHDSNYLPKLVAYTSCEAHSCVEKAAKMALVKLRILDVDENCSMRGPTLAEAIKEDQESGLHPCFVVATLGSTSSCAFDNLKEVGPIVKKLPACWLHCDGAYAGGGFICPELRYLKEGLEFADSFQTNANKWMNVCFDCTCLWVKERYKLTSSLIVEPLYLRHDRQAVTVDYRHWMIPLSRRFRALKLWFTIRNYGIEGLQAYIRNHVKLAKEFEKLVLKDNRFELCNEVRLGLVCFRLKASDFDNQALLANINKEGKIHMIPSKVHNKYIIRFCVIHPQSNQAVVEKAWEVIQQHGAAILSGKEKEKALETEDKRRASFVENVPHDLFQRFARRSTLKDGATPILVDKTDMEDEEA